MAGQVLNIPEKIFYKSFIKFNNIEKCFYKKKNIDISKRMVLYLDYPKFIHLGDILWFEPVARLLDEKFNLAICCNRPMEFYFRRLGYKIIDKSSVDSSDLLLARTELAYHLKGKNVLWINFNYINVSQPLINTVLDNIAGYLGLEKIKDAKPRDLRFSPEEKKSVADKFGIDSRYSYIVFNNYINSQKMGMRKSEFRKADAALRLFSEKFKNDNHVRVIHTGTGKDKDADKTNESIGDLDLRGMTGIEDSFVVASLENVTAYIGFDAFWLHLFNIYNKNSYIMLRPGFSAKWENQVKKYVAIPYLTPDSKINSIHWLK